jgi:hypothetical protein
MPAASASLTQVRILIALITQAPWHWWPEATPADWLATVATAGAYMNRPNAGAEIGRAYALFMETCPQLTDHNDWTCQSPLQAGGRLFEPRRPTTRTGWNRSEFGAARKQQDGLFGVSRTRLDTLPVRVHIKHARAAVNGQVGVRGQQESPPQSRLLRSGRWDSNPRPSAGNRYVKTRLRASMRVYRSHQMPSDCVRLPAIRKPNGH